MLTTDAREHVPLARAHPKLIKLHSASEVVLRSDYDSTGSRAPDMNLSDEEECKISPQVSIPIQKTNVKEGRKRTAAPIAFLSDIVNKP